VRAAVVERLRKLASGRGWTPERLLEELVLREWDRCSDGREVVRERPAVSAVDGLEFDVSFRSSVRELREALGDRLCGRELGRVLRERGCVGCNVRVGGAVRRGWKGVRVSGCDT
jgi:hypothetical protein